jgi:flagellin
MISINTNSAATSAGYNLSKSNTNLQRSLNRLSSGFRINSSFDDAGGLAVSMKLSASIRRTDSTATNVSNAISYLQTQDGILKTAGDVLTRMSELAMMSTDVTKSSDDIANYDLEYQSLADQITDMSAQTFNDIALADGATTLVVVISEDGSQNLTLTAPDLAGIGTFGTLDGSVTELDAVDDAIVALGTARATNGANQSRLTFAGDMLAVNKTNLEAANSRIIDVDVASESTQLARFNILQQSGTAMLAQANQSSQSILRLLV